ncbi:hypothetical protein OH77DRAFT_1040283 [Trametes cingulata]|nr:hypothetical protein OH77DRAFT_1040283 [Trametes cingulata]
MGGPYLAIAGKFDSHPSWCMSDGEQLRRCSASDVHLRKGPCVSSTVHRAPRGAVKPHTHDSGARQDGFPFVSLLRPLRWEARLLASPPLPRTAKTSVYELSGKFGSWLAGEWVSRRGFRVMGCRLPELIQSGSGALVTAATTARLCCIWKPTRSTRITRNKKSGVQRADR